MGIDELWEQIQQDELEDESNFATMKPTRYAKLRGIHAQRIYAAIRNGKLKTQVCTCGSKVINIAEADALFKKNKPEVEND